MIVGGTAVTGSSKRARKTYLKVVQNVQLTGEVPRIAQREGPTVGFSKEDARGLYHPHDDALVVSIRIEDYNMHRVLIDNGSSADGNQQGTVRPNKCPSSRFRRNKGATFRCGYTIRNGR